MESSWIAIFFLALPAALCWTFFFFPATSSTPAKVSGRKLPPGPPSLPIIGNLHLLGNLPHRALQKLAKTHGPIMSMRLGQVPAIVVSSPEAARLFLKTHDADFASRPRVEASEHLSYGSKGMAFTEYGPYWRSVKRLCNSKLLIGSRVEEFGSMRREEMTMLIEKLKSAAMADEVVNLSAKVDETIERMTFRMILGREKDDRYDLKGIVKETIKLEGVFNIADFVPSLRCLDLQGLTKRLRKVSQNIDELLEKIIEEHEEESLNTKERERQRDFIDLLLSFMQKQTMDPEQDDHPFTMGRENVKAIVLDMISAAFHTSSTAIDWTFSELLRHPRVMKLAQQELLNVVGANRMVEESDLPKLHYLDMVVKEAFRLHPVAPLLVPRESIGDTTVNGFFIPSKTRVFVNTWAIGRDPNVWSENALVFYPERFSGSSIELRGRDFELIPFGSGRRGCPGIQVGLITVKLVLAHLLHCFDWSLGHGLPPQDLDMTEVFGLAITRAKPLHVLATYRLNCEY